MYTDIFTLVFTDIAGIIWNFFSLLGQLACMPVYSFLGGYANLSVSNPFGYESWFLDLDFAVGLLGGDVLSRILEGLNIPNMPLIGAFLFAVALIWGIVIFIRLIIGIVT